jgi:hypothetical protein
MADKNRLTHALTAYESTHAETLAHFKRVVPRNYETFADVYEQIIKRSSGHIATKWEKGKKHLRTLPLERVFGEFSTDMLEDMVIINALVNILDDIYDEELSKEEQQLFLFEFGRLLGLIFVSNQDSVFYNSLGDFMHKLMTIAIQEPALLQKYGDSLASENEKAAALGLEVLKARAVDLDIFVEMALEFDDSDDANKILHISRVYRAVSIMHKDILDIEYDRSTGQKSIITLALNRGDVDVIKNTKAMLDDYLERITAETPNEYINEFENFISETKQLLLEISKLTADLESV